jgi:flagellum-specific ATP synthase
VVAATSDAPPLLRVQAGAVATAVAEYFRDRGCNVLLLMDSLTRLGGAQRQIGLAAGEPPGTRGYTPSVFSLLAELLERCGRTESGSITGFYTLLVEGDDPNDPMIDAVRAVTDGHVYLSAELAGRGCYPAVDVLRSVSRAMIDVTDDAHKKAAREAQKVIVTYSEIEDLVNIGAYQSGSNTDADLAIKFIPAVRELLRQEVDEQAEFEDTKRALRDLHERIAAERTRQRTQRALRAASTR